MFRALLCPSSGARDYSADYHIGRFFCKDGGSSVNVKLWFLVVYVQCEVLCRLVVAGNVFRITNPLMKHTTHKRTLRSPRIKYHNY